MKIVLAFRHRRYLAEILPGIIGFPLVMPSVETSYVLKGLMESSFYV